jgi:endonuclease YncB( thermonuclease family)
MPNPLTKICPKCNNRIDTSAVFCPNCGYFQNVGGVRQQTNSSQHSALNPWKTAVVALSAVVAVLFLALVGSIASRVPVKPSQTTQAFVPATTASPLASPEPASYNLVKKFRGKVIGVSDGDTITVLDETKTERKIRLEGIDAPESGQSFGAVSKQNLSAFVFGKTVEVVTGKKDRYGREVGKVLLDGVDVNLKQIQEGFAWHYKKYESEQADSDRKLYADAEAGARKYSLGLWKDDNPTAPWEWRSGETKSADASIIVGNKNSLIYHWAGCPSLNKISSSNRIEFSSTQEAEAAGYRAAKNCPTPPPTSQENPDSESTNAPVYLSETQNIAPPVTASTPITRTLPSPSAATTESYDYRSNSPSYETKRTDNYSAPSPSAAVSRERQVDTAPAGASALCADGTYSYSANRRGTCSHHGGVARWLSGASSASNDETYSTPEYSSPSYPSSGGTVNVRGYYRKDGTYVRSHTRRAPRRN